MRRHLIALILFPALYMVWVGDTLIRGYDLSTFDVVFRPPHWQAEHEHRGVQQIILSDLPQARYLERALKRDAAPNGQLIYEEPLILVFSWIMISLGLVACGWFVMAGRRTPGAWFLAISGAALVLYRVVELPWVANNELSERLERPAIMSGDQ